ncbi:MAG: LuxR C-terminal-related transcriptional regulator [Candidatus Limnocylindrales bacterium]
MLIEAIARDDELRAIETFLDRPADRLQALVLEGEAGIGKSTIWQAGIDAARERSFRVLVSRPAETESQLPNVVLGDLFGEVGAQQLAALPGPQRRAFESVLLLQELPDHPIDPRALGMAILTLLPSLAETGLLLVAIDDDQWLDPSSTATLQFALRRLRGQAVRLLLSRRVADAPAPGLESAADAAAIERLRVGPLSVGGIQLLLRRRLGISLSRLMLLRLHEQSGGNPFHALELAQAQSTNRPSAAIVPFVVPPSLERLVDTRLGALDTPTRRALLLIAANGRLPERFLGKLGVAPGVIAGALAERLIEQDGGAVRITHPLLASALYQGADAGDRSAAHRRLATVADDVVQRARHLAFAANAPSERVASALESALEAARSRGMPIAAAELGEHALRLTPPGAIEDRRRRSVAAARSQVEAGDRGRARALATQLLRDVAAGPRRAEALVVLAELEPPGLAVPLLEDALRDAAGVPNLEATIHASLAEVGRFVIGPAMAEGHGRALLELAERQHDNSLRATALATLALLEFDRADPGATRRAHGAWQLAASLDDPAALANAALALAHVLTWSGTIEPARAWLAGQIEEWRDRDARVLAELLWYRGFVELMGGDWARATDLAAEVRESRDPLQDDAPSGHFLPALIALHRGAFEDVREHARLALARPGMEFTEDFVAMLGMCELWSGNAAAALEHFGRAEQAAAVHGQNEPNARYWRADYVEALLQMGRLEGAERLVASWEASAALLDRDRVLAHVARCRGLIDAARGDLPAAAVALERAVELGDAAADPFGAARALLLLGSVRRRNRQKRTARVALEDAVRRFEALGATSWATAVRDELGRIGGRTRISGLSPSELRVADLVAEGRTNREIAAALFLGERTVASHLTHVYAKLGIRSRTELARQRLSWQQESARPAGNIPTS